jgi:hypothetical protein
VSLEEDTSDEDSLNSPVKESTQDSGQNTSDSSFYEEEEEEEEEEKKKKKKKRSRKVKEITITKKRPRVDNEQEEPASKQNSLLREQHAHGEKHTQVEQHGQGEQHAEGFPPGCFVVSVYQGSWYVGEVRAKEGEAGVEEGDKYLLVSFMTKFEDNSFKWPRRPELLNVLKTDVLFGCAAPNPCASNSLRRSPTIELTEGDLEKAKQLFNLFKAYFPTKIFLKRLKKEKDFLLLFFYMIRR